MTEDESTLTEEMNNVHRDWSPGAYAHPGNQPNHPGDLRTKREASIELLPALPS